MRALVPERFRRALWGAWFVSGRVLFGEEFLRVIEYRTMTVVHFLPKESDEAQDMAAQLISDLYGEHVEC